MAYSIVYNYVINERMTAAFNRMKRSSNAFSRSFGRDLEQAQTRMNRLADRARTVFKVGVVGAIGAGTLALRSFIKNASMIEDAVAGFTPLMGGAQRATELVEALNQTAASTPFQFNDISKSAKQLLPVMNGNIQQTIDTFRMLGDTAGGNAQKLDSITRGFMKSMLKGKVDMESLNMIAEAGVPIYSELAKSMGVSVKQMMEMSSAGKISSDDLQNAFKNMTSEGGVFFKGMDVASKTLSGRWSTFKDNVALTAASIGSTLLPKVKEFVDWGITAAQTARQWVDDNKELIQQGFVRFVQIAGRLFGVLGNVVGTIARMIGVMKPLLPLIISVAGAIMAYKVILAATVIAMRSYQAIMAIMKAAQFLFIAATQGMTVAQAAFNGVAMANPIGLIVIAIGVLIGIIVLLVKHWDKVKAAMVVVWEKIKELWGGVGEFFKGVWDGMVTGFKNAMQAIKTVLFTMIDVWMSTFGALAEGLIKGIGAIGKAFGKETPNVDAALATIQGMREAVRAQSLIGGVQRPTEAPVPGTAGGAVKAEASVSVYTEKGMAAEPYARRGNLGYNMESRYSR